MEKLYWPTYKINSIDSGQRKYLFILKTWRVQSGFASVEKKSTSNGEGKTCVVLCYAIWYGVLCYTGYNIFQRKENENG